MKQTWRVHDGASLQKILRRVNVDVLGRAEGRTTEQTERFSIARLLATLAPEMEYPFVLDHGDRPDFLLTFPESKIGIEHTEVVPENVAQAAFFREKGCGPDVHFLPHAKFGEPRKSARALKSEILQDKPSAGWCGNAPERETAQAIAGFAQRKCIGARKQGFRLFDKNWLLMYNNWPASAVKLGEAAAIAQLQMAAEGCFETFDRVYVVGSNKLAAVNASSVQVFNLVDPGIEC